MTDPARDQRQPTHGLALALDDLIGVIESLPVDEALRMLDFIAGQLPTGLADQTAAAAGEAHALAAATVGQTGRLLSAGHLTIPAWARLGALDTLATWVMGGGRTCMHNVTHLRPQPIFAAAWRPGLVVCWNCLHLLHNADPIVDATCDGCGYVCRGVQHGDGIRPAGMTVGLLTYRVGVCEECFLDWPREDPQ